MNKILLALLVSALPVLANANSLIFTPQGESFAIAGYDSSISTGAVSSGTFGSFSVEGGGTVTFTYLGKEAAFNNFHVYGENILTTDGGTTTNFVNSSQSPLAFYFDTQSPTPPAGVTSLAANGDIFTADSSASFAILSVLDGEDGAYYLGFNDFSTGDSDFDDFVVKLSYTSAVPVPASLPLMVSALGLFGFGVSRKRSAK